MSIKKLNITALISLLIILSTLSAQAQKTFPQKYFRSPVDFTITLSGNFAELRNNHFHSGIDIRTFTTGKKIYAIADGFVSRIKIAAGGYGKAIYIDHPNGYTSVYAHLNHFSPEIEEFVKNYQYEKKKFAFDLNLKKDQIKVQKGKIIAFSGNTGSSAGPHLHFEIRDTKSEHPLNPLLFGFKVKDTTPPKITNMYVYPLDTLSSVNGKNIRQKFPVTYYNNAYHLKGDPKISLIGNVGFALQTNDYLDNTWGKCGIYHLKFKVNDSLLTEYKFKEFSFDESRYINSHMDYSLNVKHNKRVHKTFKEPNNKLSMYTKFNNRGIYRFEKGIKYRIDFIVYDTKKNRSSLRVYARGAASEKKFKQEEFNQFMPFSDINVFKEKEVEVKFPENSFYSDLNFKYSSSRDSNLLSNIHHIHKLTTPVHKYYTIAIKPNSIPTRYDNKLIVVRFDKKNRMVNEGGVYIDGRMKTKSRYLGKFAIAVDTVPPSIKARTNFKATTLSNKERISFTIDDDLSGIKSFNGTIDGKWVLFEYDAKNKRLFYTFDKKRLFANRMHQLKLTVTDKVGNKNTFETKFKW